MGRKVTIGLAKIEMGAKGTNDAMGTSLSVIGETADGSCVIETADPEKFQIKVEESDNPIYVNTTQGETTITFQLAAPDLGQCAAVFGGTVSGTAPTETWSYPSSYISIEKSVKITPKVGLIFAIPRAQIDAKFTGGFGRADSLKIEVTVTVLQPSDDAVPPMKISYAA